MCKKCIEEGLERENKMYNVEFSYNIQIEAEDEQDVEYLAVKEFLNIDPKPDEMNINVTRISNVEKL